MRTMIASALGLILFSASAVSDKSPTQGGTCVDCIAQDAEAKDLRPREITELRDSLKKIKEGVVAQTSGKVTVGDFLRNTDGSVRTNITRYHASAECKRKGSRLPTARELALEATKYGAVLVEVADYESGKFPRGFTKEDFDLVDFRSFENVGDRFYYSYKRYKKPAGDVAKYWQWTSSSAVAMHDIISVIFFINHGAIQQDTRPYSLHDVSARCIITRLDVK